jgi:hypothetical protein
LKFGKGACLSVPRIVTGALQPAYLIMQTVDISSDVALALILLYLIHCPLPTYSFDKAVLALSLWYKHLSGGVCRLLQVPHTGITPSHLIFRTLHASQASATLRRRRASFCRTSACWSGRAGGLSRVLPLPELALLYLGIGEIDYLGRRDPLQVVYIRVDRAARNRTDNSS